MIKIAPDTLPPARGRSRDAGPAPVDVSVIVVCFNTRGTTLRCLRALYTELDRADAGFSAEVWVVDNASTDGSAAAVRSAFPGVRLIENDRNAGFGAANNRAMRDARGEFFLLLNSDAFVSPGAVGALVEFLRGHDDVGVVGPGLLNGDGSLQRSCFRYPTPGRAWLENLWVSAALPHHRTLGDYRRWAHDAPRRVDWVIGACMLVRRRAYEATGGFDERFFLYAEESDWQRRIRDAGWDVAFLPGPAVTHLGGASGAAEPARVSRHFFESLDRYQLKHHGRRGLVSLRLAMVVGCSMRLVLWSLAWLAVPARRKVARSKCRLHAWLVTRQLFQWPVSSSPGSVPGGGEA